MSRRAGVSAVMLMLRIAAVVLALAATPLLVISAEDLVEPSVCKPQLVKLVQRLLRDSVMFQFAEVILSSILYFPAPFCRHPGFNS